MKLPKIPKSFLIIGFATLVLLISYYWFSTTPLFINVYDWSQKNTLLFFIVLTLFKFFGLAYPPLPGGAFTIASVPLIGWEYAFLADAIGSTFGGIFNYFIAKKYGINFIKKVFGEDLAQKVLKIKIKKGREIESLAVLRVLTGSVVLEAIHYAAGILKVDFLKYLFAMTITTIFFGIPLFYLTSVITSRNSWWALLALLVFIPILYKLRGRYFEIVE